MTETEQRATFRGLPLKRTPKGALMVSDWLEKGGLAPIVRHRPPLWVPSMPATLREITARVHVPTMNWCGPQPRVGTPMTDVDTSAAYLSATASATFAHGPLEQTHPIGPEDFIRPGYYLVDVHPWQLSAPGSPLGSQALEGVAQVWVTHATYRLLRDLTYGTAQYPGGHWPDATVYDNWTCETHFRFTNPRGTGWTDVMRDLRAQYLDEGDTDGYEALKLGYSQAQQMWLTLPDPKGTPVADREKHNRAYRPDWSHTVRSQTAASLWRRAYLAHLTGSGHAPVAVGGAGHATDGMAFITSDLTALLAHPKTPIRLDPSGKRLGTLRMTRRYFAGQDEADDA